ASIGRSIPEMLPPRPAAHHLHPIPPPPTHPPQRRRADAQPARSPVDPTFIALVGDHDPEVVAHRAIPKALGYAALSLGRAVDAVWVSTERVAADEEEALGHVDAVWCVPASPYCSMDGALAAIRRARERG